MSFISFYKALVQQAAETVCVQMLSDEHQLLHAVAVSVVPFGAYLRMLLQERPEFIRRHGCKPLSGFAQC